MNISERPLPSLLSSIVDNRGRSCPTSDSGFPLIATNCIRRDRLYPTFDNVRFIDQETYATWFRAHPEPGDIVFVCKGDPGRTALVPNPVTFAIAQDMVALRADPRKVLPRYLLYVLRSRMVQDRISNLHVGTMIPHFKKGDFGKLSLPIHESLKEQEAIAEVLGALDDKIAANADLSAVIDRVSKTEFDMALAGGETAETTLSNVATVVLGGTPSKNVLEYWTNGTVAWLNSGAANADRILTPSELITETALSDSAAKMMPVGATLVAITGATLGQIARLEIAAAGNQSLVGVWSDDSAINDWLYFAIQANVEVLLTRATGAAQQHVSKADVSSLAIPMPSRSVLDHFAAIVSPQLKIAANAEWQSLNLAGARDALLPELMSGRLRVRDAESAASAAGL